MDAPVETLKSLNDTELFLLGFMRVEKVQETFRTYASDLLYHVAGLPNSIVNFTGEVLAHLPNGDPEVDPGRNLSVMKKAATLGEFALDIVQKIENTAAKGIVLRADGPRGCLVCTDTSDHPRP